MGYTNIWMSSRKIISLKELDIFHMFTQQATQNYASKQISEYMYVLYIKLLQYRIGIPLQLFLRQDK